jgi:hypothetical protein
MIPDSTVGFAGELIANPPAEAFPSRASHTKRFRQVIQVDGRGGGWHGDAPCRPAEASENEKPFR